MNDGTLRVELDTQKIDAIFASVNQCRLPGAAVGIAVRGKPVYRRGFGLANMELPVVLSPTIRMRIGSTSKHFTSLSYMLLCEEGKAGLDDPVGKYLPELHPVARGVTMRQLMGHTGGLRDVYELVFQLSGAGHRVSTTELLSFYRDLDDVNAPPGTAFSYNNGGYVKLSVAIERITGESLEEVLRKRIFEPIGMSDTLLRRWDTDFVHNSATLHSTGSAEGAYDRSYMGVAIAGEGGIVSTIDDMLRWLAHMDQPRVGTEATWKILRTPLRLANGTSTGYGLGLMTDRYRGVEMLHHGGGLLGGNSQMLKIPAAGLDVIVIVNRHDVSAALLSTQVLDACLPGLEPVRAPIERPLVNGTFRSSTTGRVIQLFSRGQQQLAAIQGFDVPLVTAEDGLLRLQSNLDPARVSMEPVGDPDAPAAVLFRSFGTVDELTAQRPAAQADIGSIAGRYRSHTTGTEVTIYSTGEGARLESVGRFGKAQFSLECLAEGLWRSRSMIPSSLWGGILSFDQDARTFRFSSARTSALPFKRES